MERSCALMKSVVRLDFLRPISKRTKLHAQLHLFGRSDFLTQISAWIVFHMGLIVHPGN